MHINDIAAKIAFANNAKGFAFTIDEIHQKLLLAVSEICEAQEELRDGHGVTEIYYVLHNGVRKPEGFPVELADAIIRLLHVTHNFGINIDAVIQEKLVYNRQRPLKHGR